MQESFERLLREATLVTLTLGIALGWALFQVGEGLADLVTAFFTSYPSGAEIALVTRYQALTWTVGDRILSFGNLVEGLVELGFVILVALLVIRKRAVSN